MPEFKTYSIGQYVALKKKELRPKNRKIVMKYYGNIKSCVRKISKNRRRLVHISRMFPPPTVNISDKKKLN